MITDQYSINQSVSQSIYLSCRDATDTGPDTKERCNLR